MIRVLSAIVLFLLVPTTIMRAMQVVLPEAEPKLVQQYSLLYINATEITPVLGPDQNQADQKALAIAEVLKTNTSVKKLTLVDESWSELGAQAIANVLLSNTTIKGLFIGSNTQIEADGLNAIVGSLASQSMLRELTILHNSNIDTTKLAKALSNNCPLKIII